MAFGVSKWPYPCDPRGPCFCIAGYADGGAAPYKFLATSVQVLGPWNGLNNPGLVLEWTTQVPGLCRYVWVNFAQTADLTLETVALSSPPYNPPPTETLSWNLKATTSFPIGEFNGSSSARLPDPVGMPPSVRMEGPDVEFWFPSPIVLTPKPWDFELP